MDALKLCPFCGGTADRHHDKGVRGQFHARCESCGATAPSTSAWNKRVEPEQPLADMLRTKSYLFKMDHPEDTDNWM